MYKDDDTNGHIDNFAAFVRPGVVLLAWCDDPSDPQHGISQEALELLMQERDAQGRQLQASEGQRKRVYRRRDTGAGRTHSIACLCSQSKLWRCVCTPARDTRTAAD